MSELVPVRSYSPDELEQQIKALSGTVPTQDRRRAKAYLLEESGAFTPLRGRGLKPPKQSTKAPGTRSTRKDSARRRNKIARAARRRNR